MQINEYETINFILRNNSCGGFPVGGSIYFYLHRVKNVISQTALISKVSKFFMITREKRANRT